MGRVCKLCTCEEEEEEKEDCILLMILDASPSSTVHAAYSLSMDHDDNALSPPVTEFHDRGENQASRPGGQFVK